MTIVLIKTIVFFNPVLKLYNALKKYTMYKTLRAIYLTLNKLLHLQLRLDEMAGLTKEYRCGYCYVEFNSMTKPKQLPCNHVFCLTCLQEDYQDHGGLSCPTCQ